MSRFSNVVDCQRKKCRGFSFLFDFPFYSPARFASIDSFIHSFIRLFLAFAWPLQFRFWLLVYGLNFISFHFQTSNPNSYPHAPTSPERSCVWKFWVIYQIFKVTFGIVTLVFFLCSVEIEKAFQWRYAFASQPFLKNVAYPWRCGQIALRAAFDKSET